MTALGIVLLETLSCLGLGAAALRVLRIDAELSPGEHWALAFATGFGILGWLVFPLGLAGYLTPGALTALLSVGALAAVLLRRPGPLFQRPRLDGIGKGLIALLLVVFVFDLMEGIAPPADADTLAYHFAVPRQFLRAGTIHFLPRAIDGAVPLLIQMTYVPPLALGGELAATLWALVSGWAAAALLFVLSRRYLGLNWSLFVTLVFLTTPAVIYGGGTGQVETRIALFVMVAAWATARALETGHARYAVLAGLGAGFFAAAKYTGLLFAAVAGLVLVIQRRWLGHGLVFGVALLAAGFQWYAWNTFHTGDPVFPMLFPWLGREDLAFWSLSQDALFKEIYFRAENPLPKTLLWFFLFPFKATLVPQGLPDAGRVGLGLFGLLILPFAGLGLWRNLDRVRQSPLFTYAAMAFLFYAVWFFGGGSERIRHLLPVYPLFLICVTAVAVRLTAEGKFRGPLIASAMIVIGLQMAGHGVFALNYIKYLNQGADRQAFLLRNVNGYFAVPWINAHLAPTDKVFISHRQLRFLFKVPSFFGTPLLQSAVELRPGKTDARTLYRELRSLGITHLLLSAVKERGQAGYQTGYDEPYRLLDQAGCLERLKRWQGKGVKSRTLPTLASGAETLDLVRLGGERCLG